MLEHLKAIADYLADLAYTTHLVAAPVVSSQYIVLGGRSWATPEDLPLCGVSQALETDWRLTAVAGLPDGVMIMLARLREQLSPGIRWTRIPMTGRLCWVKFERSEFVAVDRDLTVTNTNRHPAVGVDTYRIMSEPTT
jgi:hypothetical protein